MHDQDEVSKKVEQQVRRMKKAMRERPTLMSQTVFIGVLGLLLVLPIIAGAYIGHWVDQQITAYSSRWTVSLILVGLFIGIMNVYLYIKED
jgi:ATP synthase protein I|tara:strand:+ start:1453 stop:1725 length:273 start_codon:yes stop_codon:yes gene_type:complete